MNAALLIARRRLREHMREMHPRVRPVPSALTAAALAHAREHHRRSPGHYHAGPNLGPDVRPPGWRTGEDAQPKK